MIKDKKSLVVVNPVAGRRTKVNLEKEIRIWLDSNSTRADMVFTQAHGHAFSLVKEHLASSFNHFVAVGGDGTVNEMAAALYDVPGASLAIVPAGSGNGLARHLGIPSNVQKALQVAYGDKTLKTDVVLWNGRPFFSVAGTGFDAHVARLFAGMKGRGMRNYVRAVLKSFPRYQPGKYRISIANETFETRALMITVANSNQFGNNTSLAPDASLTDGAFDLCIMQKPPLLRSVIVSPLLFLKKMHKTRWLNIVRCSEATIERLQTEPIHIDGEPIASDENTILLKLIPAALNIHVKP